MTTEQRAMTPEQQAIIEKIEQRTQPQETQLPQSGLPTNAPNPVERQRFRTAAQGLTFGFADELEARARSMISDDRSYEEIRDEIRGRVKAYQEAYPTEAISLELLGAAAPTAIAFLSGVGAPGAAANTARLAPSLMRLSGIGAVEGGVAGLGYGESETLPGMAVDVGVGAGTGAVLSPALSKGTEMLIGGGVRVANWIRQKFGERQSSAAINEIKRLAQGTGKSIDEIVDDIASGKILAENRTLAAAVRAIKSKDVTEAGSAPASIDEALRRRPEQTAEKARLAVEEALYPEATVRNVFESIAASDEALKAAERKGYREVFEANPEVSAGQASALQQYAQRFPEIATELNDYYRQSNLVPLFKTEANGEIRIARIPTLEDAEVAYRLMRDQGSALWQAGKGTAAEPITDAARTLKRMLDISYPELKAVRQEAAKRLSARDAFIEGQRAFGRDADEVEFLFNDMTPEAKNAFRAGVLAAFRNKMRRSPTVAGRAADPSRQEGAILEIVAGPRYREALQTPLEIAGESAEAKNRILYGSMTAPEAAATSSIGSGVGVAQTMQALGGDPMALAAIIANKLKSEAPKLAPKDYEAVVKVLLSEDPEFVRKILQDEVSGGAIVQKIESVLSGLPEVVRKTSRVAAGGSVGLLEGL